MIYYDNAIFQLQQAGGISELYKELLSRSNPNSFRIRNLTYPRIQRYLDDFCVKDGIFHSTYYRIAPKTKNITTVHDFVYEKYSTGLRRFIHTNQKYWACKRSHKIICVSNSTREDMIRFYGDTFRKNSHVVYNGVSSEFYSLGLNRSPYDVLYVGSRARYKNFSNLVRALGAFPQLRLIIVGGGDLSPYELKLIRNNLNDRYTKVGFVTRSELIGLYNKAFFFAYPSMYEGFGIPVLEAQRCGCPVLAVDTKVIREISGESVIYADGGTAKGLKKAITRILDHSLRREVTDMGFISSSQYSWDRCKREVTEVYGMI